MSAPDPPKLQLMSETTRRAVECVLTRVLIYGAAGFSFLLYVFKPEWFRRYKKVGKVEKIYIYPVTSFQGWSLTEAICTKAGLKVLNIRDREYVVIGKNKETYEQVQSLKMKKIRLSCDAKNMILSTENMHPIKFPMDHSDVASSSNTTSTIVKMFYNTCGQLETGMACGDRVSSWLSTYLDRSKLQMVRRTDVSAWRKKDDETENVDAYNFGEMTVEDEYFDHDQDLQNIPEQEDPTGLRYFFPTKKSRKLPDLFTKLKSKLRSPDEKLKHLKIFEDSEKPSRPAGDKSKNANSYQKLADEPPKSPRPRDNKSKHTASDMNLSEETQKYSRPRDYKSKHTVSDLKPAEESLKKLRAGSLITVEEVPLADDDNNERELSESDLLNPRIGVVTVHSVSSVEKVNKIFKLEHPLTVENFRANIVISGCDCDHMAELSWDKLRIGSDVSLLVHAPDVRLIAPEFSPERVLFHGDTEPVSSLFDRWLVPAAAPAPVVGVKTTVTSEGVIAVGDPVYALSAGESFD